MKRLISILILCVLISGCAPTGEFYRVNKRGKMKLIAKLKLDRNGMIKVKDTDGLEIEMDTREKNFWQKNIVPMLAGIADKAETVVPIQ